MDTFNKKLEKIKVLFFPPGLILKFKDRSGLIENKSIDLLNLNENSDIDYLISEINKKEPLKIKQKIRKSYTKINRYNIRKI